MRNRWALLFVLMHIAGFGGSAIAQTVDQQQQCPAPDPDLSISGCTAMIQSGHETQQKLPLDFYNRGYAYFGKGQSDRAIEDFDQAIRLNPNLAQAFLGRGGVYLGNGQPDRAIEDFDQAIRLNPNYALAFNSRGNAYSGKGLTACRPGSFPPCASAIAQYDRAIEDFDQAIRLNPNYALAFNNRGNAYLVKGQPDRAIEDFDQAIRLNPNFALAFISRGRAYFSKGLTACRPASLPPCASAIAYDRAIEDFDQAIRLNPNDLMAAWAYSERSGAKSAKGDFAGAAADLAKATQLLNPSVGK
jgi:tetratricopeptide (TPR) repeat protein